MMDLVAYTPRRPKSGETLRGDSFSIALGGKGFNQAIAAGDALASALMAHRGFTAQDFGKRHPGGALGKATNK